MFRNKLFISAIIGIIFTIFSITPVMAQNSDYKELIRRMERNPLSLSFDEYIDLSRNYAEAIRDSLIFEILNIETKKQSNRKLLALYKLESSFSYNVIYNYNRQEWYSHFNKERVEKINQFLESYLTTLNIVLNDMNLLKIERELSYMNLDRHDDYSFLQKNKEARILVAELNRRTSIKDFNLSAEEVGLYEEVDFKGAYQEFMDSFDTNNYSEDTKQVPTIASYWRAIGKFMLNKSFANKLEVTEENREYLKEQSYFIKPFLSEILKSYFYLDKIDIINLEDNASTEDIIFSQGERQLFYKTIKLPASNQNYTLKPGIYQCTGDCKIDTIGKFNMHPLALITGKFMEKQNRVSIVEIAADTFGEVFVDLSTPKDHKPAKRADAPNAERAIYKTEPGCPYNICVNRHNNPFRGLGSCERWEIRYGCTNHVLVTNTRIPENGEKGAPGINAGSLVIVYKNKSHVSGNILLVAHAGNGGDGGNGGKGITNGRNSSDNCADGYAGVGGNGGNGGIIALDIDGDYTNFANHYNLWASGGIAGNEGEGLAEYQYNSAQSGRDGKITEYLGSFFQLLPYQNV